MSEPGCILILHTTLYREGGAEFDLAARELERAKLAEFPGRAVIRKAVESKNSFVTEINAVAEQAMQIAELHFIGHSGLYGIMFGTTSWPEQFSPFEWKSMKIPFANDARAYFHSCRSGRWFARFFATVFRVKAYGYFWYTTVSSQRDRFAWPVNARTNALESARTRPPMELQPVTTTVSDIPRATMVSAAWTAP